MSSTTYVKPDSVLARTAQEVLEAHAGGTGPRDGMSACPVCGQPLPCATGRAAAEVLFAAGLAQSSGLVQASRGGLGPVESPFGAPVTPAALPYPAQPSVVATVPPVAAVPLVTTAGPAAAWPVPGAPPESGAQNEVAPSGLPAAEASAVPATDTGTSGGWSTPAEYSPYGFAASDAAPPPAAEPEPTEEIDPLLLGPPIYDRQNRPLDAPRFTPSARPSIPDDTAPASGSWPAPDAPEPTATPAQAPGWGTVGEPAAAWQSGGLHPGGPVGAPSPGSAGAVPQATPPPQLGRQDTPAAGRTPPGLTPAAPVAHPPSLPMGHQTTTAALGRPARPPLEAPQMGQLNRPLQAPPAASQSAPDAGPPSGLPGATAEAPSGLPGAQPPVTPPAAPDEAPQPAYAPSGLPVVAGADQSPAPSGLWGVTRTAGGPSGLPGVPPAPAPAWTAMPDPENPAPSGLPLRSATGAGESAS